MEKGEKRHFVLVHGACHGAWCWYKVSTLLKSGGHEVTALDMAASGIHPKQVQELNSITEYNEPLMEFLRSLPQEERVILVGHSLGGICISMAMQMFPHKIAVAVFVTATMPGPDLCYPTLVEEMDQERLLFPRVRESFRPRGGAGGGWIYDPVTRWATTTGHVVRTRGGAYGAEEILERNMVLDVWIPLEEMGLQLDTHSECGGTEEPREDPRGTLRPTYAAPVFFSPTPGSVLPNAEGTHAGPSGCAGKGKRKKSDELKGATTTDSIEEDPEEEPEEDSSA